MEFEMRLERLAKELGADFFGVADLTAVRDEVRRQGGEETAAYPRAVSFGIRLFDEIVDRLPERLESETVNINYWRHCYDVPNRRLEDVASRLAGVIQAEGFRAFPLTSTERVKDERICAQFSHKLAAAEAGLGWIGKSCLLVTPEAGTRVRWGTVLTDAPLTPTGGPIEERCGECTECVDACPVRAFTGRSFKPSEPRESRYDAAKCESYFMELAKSRGSRTACGLCIYSCPVARGPKG